MTAAEVTGLLPPEHVAGLNLHTSREALQEAIVRGTENFETQKRLLSDFGDAFEVCFKRDELYSQVPAPYELTKDVQDHLKFFTAEPFTDTDIASFFDHYLDYEEVTDTETYINALAKAARYTLLDIIELLFPESKNELDL